MVPRMRHGLRYAANCSLLFTEQPLRDRPAAAAAAGFRAVEFWWPWPNRPVPADAEVDGFVSAVRDAGVELIGLNFFAGDLAGPDCGVLSLPERSQQFRDNIPVVADIAKQLGTTAFNALYGNRLAGTDPQVQDELATENLTLAAQSVAEFGGTVLIEPVSGPKPYPLRTADDVVDVLDRLSGHQVGNVGFLADLFHLANNDDDIGSALDRHAGRIAHVQIADHPGRHQPGTGNLDLAGYLDQIETNGYTGRVALEYLPATSTAESLNWLPVERRG